MKNYGQESVNGDFQFVKLENAKKIRQKCSVDSDKTRHLKN